MDGSQGSAISGVVPERAAAFAQRFGQPNVVRFVNGGTLHPALPTVEQAEAFVAEHEADIYFFPAVLRDAFVGKPSKADVIGSRWAWADIDPPKGTMPPGFQDQVIAEVQQLQVPRPTVCVKSGRGVWFFWKLNRQVTPQEVEEINYALAQELGGDHCHNCDRAARLPYTINSKAGAGQIEIAWDDEEIVHDASTMPRTEVPRTKTGASVKLAFTDDREITKLAEALAGLPEDKALQLKAAAEDPEFLVEIGAKDFDPNDRSSVMFSWAISALMAGVAPSAVRDSILIPELAISAHLLDPKKVSPSGRLRAAARQVERAYSAALGFGWMPPELVEQQLREEAAGVAAVPLVPIPQPMEPRPWLIPDLLMDGHVSMITGRGGDGKSLLALQVGAAVASGRPFAHWLPKQRRNVLVINAEDDQPELQRRLFSICQTMGLRDRDLAGLLHLSTERIALIHKEPADGSIKTAPLYDRVVELIREHGIGLLILDPLVEAHVNLNENDNSDMKELVVRLRFLARVEKLPILLIHHSRKGAMGGDQDGARGGSSLVNACRTVLTVERMDEEGHKSIRPPLEKERYIRVCGAKANYGQRIGDSWLEIVPHDLGNGDWAPSFKPIVFGELADGFNPMTHRERFLQIVEEGREGGVPWSVAQRGTRAARLDVRVAEEFGLDSKQATAFIKTYEEAGLIRVVSRRGSDRHTKDVWAVTGREPAGTIEIPF